MTNNSAIKSFHTSWLIPTAVTFFGLSLILVGNHARSGATTHSLYIGSGVAMGIALGLWWPRANQSIDAALRIDHLYWGCITLLTVIILLTISWCGMHQLGGFDHSIAIDYGWRLVSGQRPNTNFPSTVPLGFAIGSSYAYKSFGMHWYSLVWIFALFSSITFLWSTALVTAIFSSRMVGIVLSFALQAMCMIAISYWWYNPITIMSGIIYVLSAYLWIQQPRDTMTLISYFLSLSLLATMKLNIAGLLIIPVSLVIFTSREHLFKLIIGSIAAFSAFIIFVKINSLDFYSYINDCIGVAKRGFVLGQFFKDATPLEIRLSAVALLVTILPLFLIRRKESFMTNWRRSVIGVVCLAAGINSFLCAGENKVIDLSLVLLGIILIFHTAEIVMPPDGSNNKAFGTNYILSNYLFLLVILFCCVGISVGLTRHRVKLIGLGCFFEYRTSPGAVNHGFFDGVYCGQRFKDTLAEVEDLVRKNSSKKIYFGPRMQWGYAAFRFPPPVGQPVWWHPGTAFSLSDEHSLEDKWIAEQFAVCVFTRDDFTYFSREFMQKIQSHDYLVDNTSYHNLTILRRNLPMKPGH